MHLGQPQMGEARPGFGGDARARHDDQTARCSGDHAFQPRDALHRPAGTARGQDPAKPQLDRQFHRRLDIRCQVDGAVQRQIQPLRLGNQGRERCGIQTAIGS